MPKLFHGKQEHSCYNEKAASLENCFFLVNFAKAAKLLIKCCLVGHSKKHENGGIFPTWVDPPPFAGKIDQISPPPYICLSTSE